MKLEFLFASCHKPGSLVDYHSHDVLELVYYAEGEGEILFEDGGSWSFGPGSFHIAPGSCRHRQFNSSELRALCIGVSGSSLEDLSGTWSDSSGLLRYPCERLLAEMAERAVGYETVSQGLLLQIAGLARRIIASPDEAAPPKRDLVERALHMIRESGGGLSVEGLSDTLYISKDYLRHLLKQATGQSPIQHIIKARMERAGELMLSSDESVASVASRCGFSDVYYFSRLFKRHFKLPPASYRSRMTGKCK